METKNRIPHSNLIEQLLQNSSSFSFMQAVRLLGLQLNKDSHPKVPIETSLENIRIRPKLSLESPSSDLSLIEKITIDDIDTYQVTANFLGLYGTSSPLPTFYTEDLFRDEENDNNLVREFIDIFNNSIYHLYIKIFCKNRMSLQAFELKNEYFLSSALAFGGLADRNIIQKFPKKHNILRYIGVMGHLPRSALGLKIILADMLEITNIEIHQCTITTMQIPIEQQFCLGFGSCALGVDSHLGHEIASGNSGFSVRIGPVSYEEYISLIPGSEKFKIIDDIINLYIDQPLTWDVEITVEGDDVAGVCLGSEGANALGYNTWVLADDAPKPSSYKVTFQSL